MIRYLLLFLTLFGCFLQSYSQISGLNGTWEGKLMINPEMGLRLVINISGSEGEDAVVTMDSPDQGAYGIPMSINFIGPDSLNVEVKQLMLKYSGKINGDSIPGNFTQGGISMPLTLKPKITSLHRPQTPEGPFPYTVEEISFSSAKDNAKLYGTLIMPEAENYECPVVLLVSGSGIHNRDEEIFEHKPFAVISDYLARN